MLFSKEFIDEVKSGMKWATRRIWADKTAKQHMRAYLAGELVLANSNYGVSFGYLRYVRVWVERLSAMTAYDAVAEGRPYEGLDAFRNAYMVDKETKKPLPLDTFVLALEFDFVTFDGKVVPRVSS